MRFTSVCDASNLNVSRGFVIKKKEVAHQQSCLHEIPVNASHLTPQKSYFCVQYLQHTKWSHAAFYVHTVDIFWVTDLKWVHGAGENLVTLFFFLQHFFLDLNVLLKYMKYMKLSEWKNTFNLNQINFTSTHLEEVTYEPGTKL